ncbi:hypothetical protein [Nocardia amamiensis]|uniref:hypothetical protein n=1 Tax=Nocardia amamiensis TaxID=404578 RepID=UPI0033CD8428
MGRADFSARIPGSGGRRGGKYLAADRRMSRSVLSRVLSARSCWFSARSRANSCSGVSAPGLAAAADAGLRCRIGTPATLHHADNVASLTPS